MFQSDLNTFLVEKLNLNDQDMKFSGGYMFDINDGAFTIKTQVGFTIEKENFSPTQIQNWQNTSQPFARIDLQDFVLPMSFAFRQTELVRGLESLDQFRTLLNGSEATIPEIDGLNVGFRIGQPSPPSSPVTHGGEKWILVDIIIMLSGGVNLKYGNGIIYKMAKEGETLERLIYSKIDISTTNTVDASSSTYIQTSKMNKSLIQIVVDVFFEDNIAVCDDLLDELWQENSANQIYSISLQYTVSDIRIGDYRISALVQHIENGVPIGFNITLVLAG